MTNSQQLAAVRHRFQVWIADHRGPAGSEKIVREAVLIRAEFYVGRRFYTPSYQAVWFIEEGELKIYNVRGELQCALTRDQVFQEPAAVIKLPTAHVPTPADQSQQRRAA
jgi:hypothetical protein